MRNTASSNAPAVILVRPQMAENIGATARAMSNFGLTDLRLVAPRQGWTKVKAQRVASSGAHIVKHVRIFTTLPEALEDIELLYATTARPRDMEKRVVMPETAATEIHAASHRTSALMFGPERTGLENDEVVLADALITIPTDAANSSLNLAQSVVINAYAWYRASAHAPPERHGQTAALASKAEMQGFFDQLEEYLDRVDHFRAAHKKPVMLRNLQNIFVRAQMNEQEVQSLRGVVRALYMRRKTD